MKSNEELYDMEVQEGYSGSVGPWIYSAHVRARTNGMISSSKVPEY